MGEPATEVRTWLGFGINGGMSEALLPWPPNGCPEPYSFTPMPLV
jgi:hypothetical protein